MFEQTPTIPTYLWVDAKLRELSTLGISAYVANRGEKMGGLILLKIADMSGGCKLLTQQRNIDGALEWQNIFNEEFIEEKSGDEYSARAIKRDPDLWVVEIEDKAMNNPFTD